MFNKFYDAIKRFFKGDRLAKNEDGTYMTYSLEMELWP